ncbi:MAG: hypothetical protein JWP50_343 [Phenylobacterium sp.]|nr:hypothetical protein [Phenylobacterium sp.]
MQVLRQLLAVCLTVPLQACLVAADVAGYVADRPSQGVLNDMRRMCRADAGLRVFGPPPGGVDLWIPGRMSREPGPGDNLDGVRPVDSWWNTDEPWLSRGLARAVYVNIDPSTDSPPMYQGPKRGEPAGLYRFELAPANDARCVAHQAAVVAWFKKIPGQAAAAPQAGQTCIAYRHVGPFDFHPRPDMFIRFDHAALAARGILRSGEVLFVRGQLRARFVRYQAYKPGRLDSNGTWQSSDCEKPSKGLPDGL